MSDEADLGGVIVHIGGDADGLVQMADKSIARVDALTSSLERLQAVKTSTVGSGSSIGSDGTYDLAGSYDLQVDVDRANKAAASAQSYNQAREQMQSNGNWIEHEDDYKPKRKGGGGGEEEEEGEGVPEGGGEHGGIARAAIMTFGRGHEMQLYSLQHLVTSMGVAWAGVGVAAVAVVSIVEHQIAQARENREAVISYNNELEKSARHWDSISSGVVSTTQAGRQYASEAASANEHLHDLQEEEAKRGREFHPMETLFHTDVDTQREDIVNKKIHDAHVLTDILKEAADRQAALAVGRGQTNNAMELAGVQIGEMHDGIPQSQARIVNETSQRMNKQIDDNSDKLDTFDTATSVSRMQGHQNDPVWEAEQAKKRQAIVQEGSDKLSTIDAEGRSKMIANSNQWAEKLLTDQRTLTQSRISLTSEGFEREQALAAEHAAEMVQDYQKQGRDTSVIQANAAAQAALAVKMHNREITDSQESLTRQLEGITHAVPAGELAWEQYSLHLVRDMNISGAALEGFHQMFMQVQHAMADQPIRDSMKSTSISIQEATHHINALEAAYRRMLLANPDANPELLRQAAAKEEQLKNVNFAHQEMSQLPVTGVIMQMQDYARQIQAAVKDHSLSPEDAERLYKNKARETGLTKEIDPGQFGGSSQGWRAGQVDISAVNMNQPLDKLSVHMSKHGELLATIADNTGKVLSQEQLN